MPPSYRSSLSAAVPSSPFYPMRSHARTLFRLRLIPSISLNTLTLLCIGIVCGFAVTMCVQSLNSLPSISSNGNSCTPFPVASDPGSEQGVRVRTGPSDLNSRTLMARQQQQDQLPTTQASSSSQNLIMVGIMTAQKYVDTRAWTVWKTWAQTLPGKIFFFVSEDTTTIHPELPIVRLPGVDDSYPPQKKSFMMLRWMSIHGLGRFEWFLRADDDVYVRGDKLEIFLRSLNSSKALFLGQAGLGTPEEYGTLSLGEEDNYCMGGPGIILSQATLAGIKPHISNCLRNMYTTHEDVEIGRCVRKYAGTSCSWSYEMQTIFYNNQSGLNAYSGDLNVAEVHQSISLHPIKKPHLMQRLHAYMRRLKTSDLRFRSLQLSRDVVTSIRELRRAGSYSDASDAFKYSEQGLPPSLLRHTATNPDEILLWNFLSPTLLYCAGQVNCPRHNTHSYIRYALRDVIRQLMDILNHLARQRGRWLEFQDILYGYHRVDPVHGAEYILDVLLLYKKFRGKRVTVPVRRHAYLQQSFSALEVVLEEEWRDIVTMVDKPQVHQLRNSETAVAALTEEELEKQGLFRQDTPVQSVDSERINIVLPLAGRSEAFVRFLHHFKEKCVDSPDADTNVYLRVVLFVSESPSEEDDLNRASLENLKEKVGRGRISWIEITDTAFSRGLALARGAASLPSNSLLFFADADILFDSQALMRLRRNTVRGKQVYFPIVFSEFTPSTWGDEAERSGLDTDQPDSNHFSFSQNRGYFRHFGFGIASMFRSDLDAIGGVETGIHGWGLEDVNLFEKSLFNASLTVFRAPEPGLVHVYHPVNCDRNLSPSQYEMCLGSRYASYSSADSLAEIVHNDPRFAQFFPEKSDADERQR